MTLLFSIIESFFSLFALVRLTGMETSNPFTFILFFCFLFIYYKMQQIIVANKVGSLDHVHAGLLSLLFTTFTVLANYEQLTLHITSNLFCAFILTGSAIGFFIALYHFILWVFYETYDFHINNTLYPVVSLPVITFFACLIAWLPYFLFEYPGVMTPDSINQFSQAVGIWKLNNQHSVLHTLMILVCYKSGLFFTNDPVSSIAFYTVFQMLFMAFCASYVVRTLQIAKLKTSLCIMTILFYALLPYQGIMAVTIWKDVMFTGFVVLFTASLIRLFILDERKNPNMAKTMITIILPYMISGFGICLLRSNGLIALLVTIPFVIFTFREKLKALLPATVIMLLLALFIRFPCMQIYKIEQADFVESISIPAQQLARVIADGYTLSEKDTEELNQYMDVSQVASVYEQHVSDPIKNLIRETNTIDIENNKLSFLGFWFRMGLKYPKAYLDGFIDQTYGYWYPSLDEHTGLADGIYPNDLGLSWKPIISGSVIVKIREILFKLQEMIPLYGLLWSVGAIFWAILLSVGICFIRRKNDRAVFLVFPIMLVLTLILATPVACDFRYAYPLVYGLPLFLFVPFI